MLAIFPDVSFAFIVTVFVPASLGFNSIVHTHLFISSVNEVHAAFASLSEAVDGFKADKSAVTEFKSKSFAEMLIETSTGTIFGENVLRLMSFLSIVNVPV